jgi:hypothetical protein
MNDVPTSVNGSEVILLEYEADIPLIEFNAIFWFQFVNGFTEEKIFATPGGVEHSENGEKRRLASSGWTHDGDEVAILNI